jgi:hypothetical protein
MFKTTDFLLSILVCLNILLVYFEFQEHLHSKHVTRWIFIKKRLNRWWLKVKSLFNRG